MKTDSRSPEKYITVAFVHHANQLMITDGYQNRNGITAILGIDRSRTGLRRVLEIHKHYKIPVNLHITGLLLETIAWHSPDFLAELEELARLQLLDLLGSSYGQNMMRFFSPRHNHRQVTEQLRLYESLLNWNPESVRVFWPPERLWDTETLAPILADPDLPNGGYKYVIIDDRLLYPGREKPSPRQSYDREQFWVASNFQTHIIENGRGLSVLPISNTLRQNIPPRGTQNLESVKAQLSWLLDNNIDHNNKLIAVYADDMEKAAGAGWDPSGPAQYEVAVKWIAENPWVKAIRLSEWQSEDSNKREAEKPIETGTYSELANEFGAGETFENWYYDPRWTIYRNCQVWAEERIQELEDQGSDATLIELAWKTLLATSWQTAWHTPRTGAHGDPNSDAGPSPWVKAIASHSRLAVIIAEAAHWAELKDGKAHAYLQDLDRDGQDELILKNNYLYAVLSPRNGGRLVYLFATGKPGRLIVGNPIDDWNLLEELHGYMDIPPNHPGAMTDVGYEHDTYTPTINALVGEEVSTKLQNIQKGSNTSLVEKRFTLREDEKAIRVDYKLPGQIDHFSVEIGLSPDYLNLLRHGPSILKDYAPTNGIRGWATSDLIAYVKIEPNRTFWDKPRQTKFGHGHLLRVTSFNPEFTIWLGVDRPN